MIKSNAHKYKVSAMCKVLNIPRSTYYYESKSTEFVDELTPHIKKIFKESRNNYGTRKIKIELEKLGIKASRRKIGRIMKKEGLVSQYTTMQYKVHNSKCNEDKVNNELNRNFKETKPYNAIVSDLSYVRVGKNWNYICILIDLFNREIIGFSVGKHKDSAMVYKAFLTVKTNLNNIQLFHTDRGREFKNKLIDNVLETFNIKRSLSMKGCPYDNAVAESAFKVIKTEFIKFSSFDNLDELRILFSDYVNWYNNFRIHGTLGYLTPKEYKQKYLKKIV